MTSRIMLTHGCSLSNLPLFVAEGAGLFAAEGLEVEVPRFTTLSATADILESGLSELGTVAFTEPLIDAHRSNPPIIVGGSGLMGITIMAQPEITSVGQLEGLKAGTFRRDPLEVLLHDALAAHGLGFDDLEIVYLDDIDDALAAFESRRIDAITLAEPHASRIRRLGAVQLSDGTELWGEPFPDTVLVATVGFLEAKPDLVSAALRAMIRAEQMIAADPSGMLDYAQRHYPGYDRDDLEVGARRQPPCIDIRYLEQTVYDRWDSLRSLGLVPSDAQLPANVVSFDLLAAELERAGLEGPESPPRTMQQGRGLL
ncbi:MAG: ABC transporter substrate-binding protein [Alphaproteobacteria bacterium]|nr:ABC transporter substrate-binding protein [Alphaproteobacteria bacterium]